MKNHINLRSLGTPSFLRFIVVNDDMFWNGSTWVADCGSAMLYASFKDAVAVWRKLREESMDGTPHLRFEARVVVTVCSNEPVNESRLRTFLENNSTLTVDLEEEPTELVIDVKIDWTTLATELQTNLDARHLARAIYNEFKSQLGCDVGNVDAALDPNRMRLLFWDDRPACKQAWINAVHNALQRMRSEK